MPSTGPAIIPPYMHPKKPMRFLGRKPPKLDKRNLLFEKYLRPSLLPPIPAAMNRGAAIPNWPMMLNDREGDCTIACAGHMDGFWTYEASATEVIISDADIQSAYVAVTGEEGAAYNPSTGANDNGCAILDVLNYWKGTGIGGRKISAFTQIQSVTVYHAILSAYLFGCTYLGVSLPLSAEGQINAGKSWTVSGAAVYGDVTPGSWGGHAIPIVSWDRYGFWVVTWGQLQYLSQPWFLKYCDEAYAVLSIDWLKAGKSPSGFDYAQLLADLSLV